jgi:hypothetical protein
MAKFGPVGVEAGPLLASKWQAEQERTRLVKSERW